MRKLKKSIIDGDIYEAAHNLAERQLIKPSLEALDMTHRHIAEYCD
jgi:hypothetical protein